jgi:long-subunit acyl-CoA synthetase (AMP-forming)
MSISRVTNSRRIVGDHFEPDDVDPKAQRQLRGHLEEIDYTAYAANRKVLGAALKSTDVQRFQRLGLAAALARARWVAAALAATDGGQAPSPAVIEQLAHLRTAYEELAEVYDAMRRMVERGYLPYAASPPQCD